MKELIEEEKAFRKGILSVNDLIAPAGVQVTHDYIRLNGKFVRTPFYYRLS